MRSMTCGGEVTILQTAEYDNELDAECALICGIDEFIKRPILWRVLPEVYSNADFGSIGTTYMGRCRAFPQQQKN